MRTALLLVCLLMAGCARSPARPLPSLTVENLGNVHTLSLLCPTPDSLCLAYGSTTAMGGRGTTRIRFGNTEAWASETVVDSNEACDCRLLRSPKGTLYALIVPSMVLFRLDSDGSIAEKVWLGFSGVDRPRDADIRFEGEDSLLVAYRRDHALMLASWSSTGAFFDSTCISSTLSEDSTTPTVGLVLRDDNALLLCVDGADVEAFTVGRGNLRHVDPVGGPAAELRVSSGHVFMVRDRTVEVLPVTEGNPPGPARRLGLDSPYAPGPLTRGSFAVGMDDQGQGNMAWFTFGQAFDSLGWWPMMDSRYVVHHAVFTMNARGVPQVRTQGEVVLPRTESATAIAIGSRVLAVASSSDYLKTGRIRFYRLP